jgi:two-component system sensor histidine kinase/response regulator
MKRILIIEDAPDLRAMISEVLQCNGWQALSASDGEQGLALAKGQIPDLILCDIRMPRRDGYSVLKELRANPATASVPFVFLTGLGEKPNVRQGMELGADDYIVKPFTAAELTAAIEARFRKQAAMIELAEKKLNDLRGTLKSALPHEMVTPLNTILGFSSLIMDGLDLTLQDAREYAGHILESGERLHHLIESFVFYSHLELSASDPEQLAAFKVAEPIPTRERIKLIAERAAMAAHRQPDLTLELQEIAARAAQIHLDRIIQELSENAFKFSTPGRPVRLASKAEEGMFQLTVSNQGRGLTTEEIARIGAHLQFDRQSQEQQGTGLGLAIVKRLTQLYGGTFWIESVPNQITSMHVRLRSG